MANIIIRPAMAADAEPVTGLCRQLGYEATVAAVRIRIERAMRDAAAAVFVAEKNGRVAGWIQVSTRMTIESEDGVEITGLVVDESERGRGIGKSLVRRAEEWAKELEYASLRVRTNVVRAETHRFYQRLGFVEAKRQTVFRKQLQ